MENMTKNMGKFPEEPVRKGTRNKATSDFLIMCGLKKPDKDLGKRNEDLHYRNEGIFFNTEFPVVEPMTDPLYSDIEIDLIRKYNIKDCYVKLTKVEKMMEDSDYEHEIHYNRENGINRITCQYCKEEFDALWKKHNHIVIAHREELTCDVCLKFFKTSRRLQLHKKTHTTLHQCRLCNQCFTTTFMLDTHFLSKHAGIQPFSCKYCAKQFSLGSAHKRHEKSHRRRNPKQMLRCRYCNRFFEEISHLQKHIRLSHDEKKLTCKFCGMKHNSYNSLKNHLFTHQDYRCSNCGEKFLKKSYLRNHLEKGCSGEANDMSDENISENQATLTCQYCAKRFVTMRNLKRHMSAFHSEGETYYCEDCHTRFETEELLKKHVHIKCKVCDQSFSNIETHMLRSHPADSPYNCAVCGAAFSSLTRMRQHLKVHNAEFGCEYCFKTFSRGHHLEYHILRKHIVEKSFTCDVCEKSYPSVELLKEHKKIVHTQDCFECDFCKRTFNKFLLLEKHITKLHAGGKPLQCDFCPKRFGSNALLKSHEKFHFMSYECISCASVFKASDCLKAHVKEEHGSEVMKEELFDSDLPRCLCCSRTFKNSDYLKKHIEDEHDSYNCSTHNKNKNKPASKANGEKINVKEEYKEYESVTNSFEYCSNF